MTPNVLKSPKNSNRFSTFRRWPSGYRFASNAPLSEENKGRLGASVAARVGHKKRVYRGGESCIDAAGRDYLPGRSRVTPYGIRKQTIQYGLQGSCDAWADKEGSSVMAGPRKGALVAL